MLTPMISAVRQAYPHAEIWVLVRKDCHAILEGCRAIDTIALSEAVSVREKRSYWNWLPDFLLILKLRRQKFDYLFELGDGHRGRWFTLMSGAKRRFSVKPVTPLDPIWRRVFTGISQFDWPFRHRVEKDYYSVSEFLPLPDRPLPGLGFETHPINEWSAGADLKDFVFVHCGTRGPTKRWQREKWLQVCRFLLHHVENIVLSAGPSEDEQEEVRWISHHLGARAVSTGGGLTLSENAALLRRSRMYVGLDTSIMHLAAACGTPCVALFGPSVEANWRPWMVEHRIVTPRGFMPADVDTEVKVQQRRTVDIEADDVVAACRDMLTLHQDVRRENIPAL